MTSLRKFSQRQHGGKLSKHTGAKHAPAILFDTPATGPVSHAHFDAIAKAAKPTTPVDRVRRSPAALAAIDTPEQTEADQDVFLEAQEANHEITERRRAADLLYDVVAAKSVAASKCRVNKDGSPNKQDMKKHMRELGFVLSDDKGWVRG